MNTIRDSTALVKATRSSALARVSNQLALTDKLLTKPEEPFLIPYRKGDKWGFCDRNKNIVVDCIYRHVNVLSKDLYKVYLNGKQAFINKRGGIITDYYEWLDYNFYDGLCCAKKDGKFGFINTEGKIASFFLSDRRSKFYEGLASVYRQNRKVRSTFIGVNNLYVKAIQGQYLDAGDFSEGLAAVVPVVEGEEYEGQGYEDFGYRVGFINRLGEMVIPPIYEFPKDGDIPYLSDAEGGHAYRFINGLAEVCLLNKWGAVNKLGEITIPILYDELFNYGDLFSAWINNVCVAYFDISGAEVDLPLKPHIDFYYGDFLAGEVEGKWGFLDKRFNIVIPPIYEDVKKFSEGLSPVKKNELWGFINTQNEVVINFQFSQARPFSDGLSAVEFNGKYGFINNNGDLVLDFQYAEVCEDFKSGIARVTRERKAPYDKTGYINKNGIEYWED